MKLYNRETRKYIKEKEAGTKELNFLYTTIPGRLLLKIAINPITSEIYGIYNKSKLSKNKIQKFIKENNIDISRYATKNYKSFNDFFTRRLRASEIAIESDTNIFISPCDGKLLAYNIKDDSELNIKGTTYTIKELLNEIPTLKDKNITQALVFRLSLDDYHRYCFIDDCSILDKREIPGKLHTIRSISKDYQVFKTNKRTWSLLNTKNFGLIYQIEIGAMFVGSIYNKGGYKFLKGEEKGYFSIGGSTIVLLIGNNIKIDSDILKQSSLGIETIVHYGEKIGIKPNVDERDNK